MGILGTKENKLQLYFKDDNSFSFIKRDVMYTCLVEKSNDKLVRGWKHFYGNQIPFAGYKNMPAGHASLGFSRDIILDPFDRIPKGSSASQKPLSGAANIKQWISGVAENQRHIFRAKRETSYWTSRITWAFIGVLTVMVLVWGVAFMQRIYG